MKSKLYGHNQGSAIIMRGILIIGTLGAMTAAVWAGDLSPDQQQQFEKMKTHFDYELGVCKEDCGPDAACLEKCQKAYTRRLDNAHQQLLYGTAPTNDIQEMAACPYCGMSREKFAHSRLFVTYDDGTRLGACSIHCAVIDMTVNIDKGPVKVWVGDYKTKTLIDAEKAVWVIGGDKTGVMTRNAKWAFGKRQDADHYVQAHGGKLAGFEEVMAAVYADMYEDTKMIRDKRKKMRMMKMKPMQ